MNHTQTNQVTEQDVIDYLKSHPKFLQKNPDAVDYLLPPKDTANGRHVVDFQHYMVEKLKADKRMVLDTTRDIIEVSRENMNNLARIHEAVLKILEAENFDHLIQIITVDVAAALDCDAVSLVMEDLSVFPTSELRAMREVAKGTLARWMNGNYSRVQSNINGAPEIFGEAAGLVKSQALIKINQTMGIPPTILAFGSRDPEMFIDGQGTDLISFLCHVVERALKLWMK
jgi:uncharacterized protein